jgi:fructose-bisphosphate aldolase class I
VSNESLEATAQALVADGKGILAADETVRTISKRFAALGIASTEASRREYREMLVTTPDLSRFVSGVILYDETIRQADSRGVPLVQVSSQAGIIPGIKVDTGAKPLAACAGETVTEGLDGLRRRLKEYVQLGGRFAKWRAVIHVSDVLPSETCVEANAHALACYAALCQEQGLVPIVEPEVLMDGAHSLARAEEVTGNVLACVFAALRGMSIVARSAGELAALSADPRSRPLPPSLPGLCTLPIDASGAEGARTPPHPTTIAADANSASDFATEANPRPNGRTSQRSRVRGAVAS